jgi:hypothetical protein
MIHSPRTAASRNSLSYNRDDGINPRLSAPTFDDVTGVTVSVDGTNTGPVASLSTRSTSRSRRRLRRCSAARAAASAWIRPAS